MLANLFFKHLAEGLAREQDLKADLGGAPTGGRRAHPSPVLSAC